MIQPVSRAILISIFALTPAANAQTLQQQTAVIWRNMTICAQQAAAQFPDHTPEGNANREKARLDCLRRNHLPVDPQPPGHYSPPH
jgi:hypothetical protein